MSRGRRSSSAARAPAERLLQRHLWPRPVLRRGTGILGERRLPVLWPALLYTPDGVVHGFGHELTSCRELQSAPAARLRLASVAELQG